MPIKCDQPSAYTSNPPLYDSLNLVNHNQQIDRLRQMANREQVKQEDKARITKDWRSETTIPEEYKMHRDEFLQLLCEFENIWDGRQSRIKTGKHQIKLMSKEICRVHIVQYLTGRTERQFPAKKIKEMLQEELVEPANTK